MLTGWTFVMNAIRGFFRRPLDEVFAAPSHVAVVRALLDSAQGMSGREVGRSAHVSHVAAARALRRLEACGVVEALGSGSRRLYRLNQDSSVVVDLVRPLLLREREVYGRLIELIRTSVKGRGVTVVIFGSAARQEESAGSDLDLLFIIPAGGQGPAVQETAAVLSEEIRGQFGFHASPIVLTGAELRRLDRRGAPLIDAVRQQGVLVTGPGIEEVLHGARRRPSNR